MPKYYLLGLWSALSVCVIFLGIYAYVIAAEARKRSAALNKLEKSLSKRGFDTTLIEKHGDLGGRARNTPWNNKSCC